MKDWWNVCIALSLLFMDPMGYLSNAITNASFKKCIFGVRIALVNSLASFFTYSSILAERMVKFYIYVENSQLIIFMHPVCVLIAKSTEEKRFFKNSVQKWGSKDTFYNIFSFKNNMVEWDKIVLMVFHRCMAEL